MSIDDAVLDELVERAAMRAAEIVAKKSAGDGGHWLRGAVKIAAYIDAPVSRVNALSSAGRIPVERDGSALVANTAKLDAWIEAGGGKRP